MLSHVLFGILVVFGSLPKEITGDKQADMGQWKVGTCIMAKFAMKFLIHPNVTDGNQTEPVNVPANAKADDSGEKNCKNGSQTLILNWQDESRNATGKLDRNLRIVFQEKVNNSYYGVQRIYAEFELAKFPYRVDNKTVNATSKLQIDSKEMPKLMFHTPMDRSFLCANINNVTLTTDLVYSVNTAPKSMSKTVLSAEHVQFDAFRPSKKSPSTFRTPMDCDYQPDDIAPIAVGVALAALVVIVLVAYMIGRRRIRQQGYQSV